MYNVIYQERCIRKARRNCQRSWPSEHVWVVESGGWVLRTYLTIGSVFIIACWGHGFILTISCLHQSDVGRPCTCCGGEGFIDRGRRFPIVKITKEVIECDSYAPAPMISNTIPGITISPAAMHNSTKIASFKQPIGGRKYSVYMFSNAAAFAG